MRGKILDALFQSMKVDKNTVSRWGIYKLGKRLNKKNYFREHIRWQ